MGTQEPSITVSIRVPVPVHAVLSELADELRLPVSTVVRLLVDVGLLNEAALKHLKRLAAERV